MADLRDDCSYMMPAHFGGQPGGMPAQVYERTVSATVRYETDAQALQALLPPGMRLDRGEVMVSAMMNAGTNWMAGEPYNILAVNAPATYHGKKETVTGWFSLVVWENNTVPVLPGREQTGIPKIHGEIEDFRFSGDEMRTWAHRSGQTFCNLHFTRLGEAAPDHAQAIEDEFAKMAWLGWRYIPNTGATPGAALSHATIFPQEFTDMSIRTGSASIVWAVPEPWQNVTQHHVIAQLAALPVGKPVGPAVVMEARNVLRGDKARALI